jgi:hypothetical protein
MSNHKSAQAYVSLPPDGQKVRDGLPAMRGIVDVGQIQQIQGGMAEDRAGAGNAMHGHGKVMGRK